MTKSMCLIAVVAFALGELTVSHTSVTANTGTILPKDKQFLNHDYTGKPNGYTHVVASPPGRMIYLSGAGGTDRDGNLPADFATQAHNTFKHLENGLKMAGAGFEDVVKINYYLTDITNLGELRKVRPNYLNMDTPPAATAVEVGLFGDILLEVDLVAIVPK